MNNINLKIKLISDEDNIDISLTGYKNNNIIKYKEQGIDVTLNIQNDQLIMTRACNDYTINLIFNKKNNTISTYQVFGGSKTFELFTQTTKLIIDNTKILIDYILEGNKFSYSLEMEEV